MLNNTLEAIPTNNLENESELDVHTCLFERS
jgi:hypothetical protein